MENVQNADQHLDQRIRYNQPMLNVSNAKSKLQFAVLVSRKGVTVAEHWKMHGKGILGCCFSFMNNNFFYKKSYFNYESPEIF